MAPGQTALQLKAVKAALDVREHGWAVIEEVLTAVECAEYVDSAWDWLEALDTGIDRHQPATWKAENWPPSVRGIINTLEVPHQAFVWKVRSNPKVLQVFQALWGTNELLSSFDSINIVRPGGDHESGSWLHVDQAPLRKGLACIQGLVNLVDVGPQTGTLLVKDGSHDSHEEFFQEASVLSPEQKAETADFYQFKPQELPFFDKFKSMPLCGKAGSLFLWESRTAHQNLLPESPDAFRHVCYVCYQPRSFATEQDLQVKKEAWERYRATTHWPAQNVAMFPELGPAYYSISKDEAGQQQKAQLMQHLNKFKLNRTREKLSNLADVKRLAGVEQYAPDTIRQSIPLVSMNDEELRTMLKQQP